MRSRSDLDIMAKILHTANEKSGAGRTKIMYGAFLSYKQLKKYLPALTERGLLNYDIDAQTFKTTQKGLRFLDTYNQIYDAIKILPPRLRLHLQQKQV
jgi:predicted transcriptional regulator